MAVPGFHLVRRTICIDWVRKPDGTAEGRQEGEDIPVTGSLVRLVIASGISRHQSHLPRHQQQPKDHERSPRNQMDDVDRDDPRDGLAKHHTQQS